ncbi:MAG: hypothetical protein ACOCXX_03935, partial [Planctomycetota bacterium]
VRGFEVAAGRIASMLDSGKVDQRIALAWLDAARGARCWHWGRLDEALEQAPNLPAEDDRSARHATLWRFIRTHLDSPLVLDADAAIALHASPRAEHLAAHLRRFDESPYAGLAVEGVMEDYLERDQVGLALAFARSRLKPWTPAPLKARLELWLGRTNESIAGRMDDALDWYRRIDDSAGKLPEWAEAVQRLAVLEARRGNLPAAMQATSRLMRRAPDHPWVRSGEALGHLAELYLKRSAADKPTGTWKQRAFETYLVYMTTYRDAERVENLSLLKRLVPLMDDAMLARYVEALPDDFEAIYPPDLSGRVLEDLPLNAWDRKRIDRIRRRLNAPRNEGESPGPSPPSATPAPADRRPRP